MLKQYFKYAPQKIIEDVSQLKETRTASINGIELLIDPFVYPSDQFRSSNFLVSELIGIFKGQKICDMGCGPGIIGIVAAYDDASYIVQVDVNPYAVDNARHNRSYHGFPKKRLRIYESDCFDLVPKQKFDYIVFNPPFHSEEVEVSQPVEMAFIDPKFITMEKFLMQAYDYLENEGKIVIAFSNKGDTKTLENLFLKYGYESLLWKTKNTESLYDTRLYLLNQ